MKRFEFSDYPEEFMADDHKDVDLEPLDLGIHDDDDPEMRYAVIDYAAVSPEEAGIQAHEYQQLRAAVAKLREPSRYIIRRLYGIDCEPMLLKDIAEQIGFTNNRLFNRLNLGRTMLKGLYKGER